MTAQDLPPALPGSVLWEARGPTAPLDLDAIRNQRPPDDVAVWEVGEPQMLALLAEMERLRAESVPRSALVQVRGWRWCEAKDAPESWEDGNGCLWCFESDGHHPRLYVIRKDTDA